MKKLILLILFLIILFFSIFVVDYAYSQTGIVADMAEDIGVDDSAFGGNLTCSVDVQECLDEISTATFGHSDGANCTIGYSPLGVDESGAVQQCFDVATQTELNTHEGNSSIHHAKAVSEDIDHNQTVNYEANRHIDWTGASNNFYTTFSARVDEAFLVGMSATGDAHFEMQIADDSYHGMRIIQFGGTPAGNYLEFLDYLSNDVFIVNEVGTIKTDGDFCNLSSSSCTSAVEVSDAYGWGNHSVQNYLDLDDDTDDLAEGTTNLYWDGDEARLIASAYGG